MSIYNVSRRTTRLGKQIAGQRAALGNRDEAPGRDGLCL